MLLTCAVVVVVVAVVWHASAGIDLWSSPPFAARAALGSTRTAPRSLVLAAARNLPEHDVLFTNLPHSTWLATGHYSMPFPAQRSIWTGERNHGYTQELAAIGAALCRRPGAVVYHGGSYGQYLFLNGTIARDLRIAWKGRDGVILTVDPARCPT